MTLETKRPTNETTMWGSPPRNTNAKRKYVGGPGFRKSASLDDIRNHGHVLTPGRQVGAEDVEDDGNPRTGHRGHD